MGGCTCHDCECDSCRVCREARGREVEVEAEREQCKAEKEVRLLNTRRYVLAVTSSDLPPPVTEPLKMCLPPSRSPALKPQPNPYAMLAYTPRVKTAAARSRFYESPALPPPPTAASRAPSLLVLDERPSSVSTAVGLRRSRIFGEFAGQCEFASKEARDWPIWVPDQEEQVRK